MLFHISKKEKKTKDEDSRAHSTAMIPPTLNIYPVHKVGPGMA
jgi:hypothetical protein